jgi:hypothetical protein
LSVYLISLTELNQLVKIPVLIEHFIEHKEKNTELSLWQFLDMHYAHGDVKDADYDRDMQLPFKSHDGCISSLMPVFVPGSFSLILERPIPLENNNYFIYTEQFLNSAFLSSIWQPPKSC